MRRKWSVSLIAILVRLVILLWGIYQDATIIPRFTDVDYMVFTDAARYVSLGDSDGSNFIGRLFGSPYDRDTYRYTPLLAWLLVPTNLEIRGLFSYGKVSFCVGDLIAGDLIIRVLEHEGYSQMEALIYAAVWWLFNPVVATISARGSSEGLLGVVVMLIVYFAVKKRHFATGLVTGLGVHFKIYPFIYIPAIVWSMGTKRLNPFERCRLSFLFGASLSFTVSSGMMYGIYGDEYIQHSWIHHLIRLDHRHNFSSYSTVLYYSSASGATISADGSNAAAVSAFEHWAFVPQSLLSAVIIPLAFARKNLVRTMALQTITFVTFNKVCTSQYFLWYIVLLPFYMPRSIKQFERKRELFFWLTLIGLWVITQAFWLYHGYQLEFLGVSTYYPQSFRDTVWFFSANIALIVSMIQYI